MTPSNYPHICPIMRRSISFMGSIEVKANCCTRTHRHKINTSKVWKLFTVSDDTTQWWHNTAMTQSSPDKPYATTFVTANIWKKLTKGKWQKLKLQGSSLSTERIKAATSQQQSKTISNVLPNLSNYACVKALCESCQANNKTNRDSTRPVSTLVKHITY